ncbi:MAG TPA: hypothetical protein PKE46_10570 [Micropruina sp.]|nr:hypothetical protein [Micropruina sp.]
MTSTVNVAGRELTPENAALVQARVTARVAEMDATCAAWRLAGYVDAAASSLLLLAEYLESPSDDGCPGRLTGALLRDLARLGADALSKHIQAEAAAERLTTIAVEGLTS